MSPSFDDLVQRYQKMGEDELADLARVFHSLTEPAKAALEAEYARRSLTRPPVDDLPVIAQRRWATVCRYRDLSEAIVARSVLNSAGLHTFLCDENLIRLDWQVSNFIGGIRLQVEDDEQTVAAELLSQPMLDPIPFAEGAIYEQPHCPVCQSLDTTFQGSGRAFALISLHTVSVPLPLGKETWLCNACGARWEDSGDEDER